MHAVNERTVRVGDVDLSIAEAGVGGRPLLLLHGFTGAKEDFAEWLDPLGDAGWHAVAPDHRGHGASSKPTQEDDYSFEILAADTADLVDALGWGGTPSSATRWAAWWPNSWPSRLPIASTRWS